MSSLFNTSMMSQLGQVVQMGQDVMKMARQAVKGMGQDARFFRDSKRGECGGRRAPAPAPAGAPAHPARCPP
jgi:hypothetical protein